MKKQTTSLGFIAATLSLLMAFAASGTPIPLYELYHRVDGVGYRALALTSVAYFIGIVSTLLVMGRISNHLGRKPVAFLVFGFAALSCIFLLHVDGPMPLLVGRFLLGIACGLASSGLNAYVADTAPAAPAWLSPTIISNAALVGLTLGAMGAGALVEYAPYPRALCYLVVLAGLAVCALLIACSEETVARKPGLVKSLRPECAMPQADKRLYPVAACTFVATWALGGFNLSYSATIAAEQLGSVNAFTAALVFSAYLLPGAVGGPLTARMTDARAKRYGMVIFTLAVFGYIMSMKWGTLTGFLMSSAIAGAAQGAVLTSTVRTLMAGVAKEERAAVLSLIFATSYLGAAVPSFIAGELSRHMDLFHVSFLYGALAVAACGVTLRYTQEPPNPFQENAYVT